MQPPKPAHHAAEEEPATAEEESCPGHGPTDPPPPPNWWHGLLMANNERAEAGGFVNRLLFRYENEKNRCDPRNEPPPFLASVINFFILGAILYGYGRKPLQEALVKRRDTIMAEIDTAARLHEQAEERLREYEEKLENLNERLARFRAEYAEQSAAEKRHLVAEAEERRARMRRDAEFRVEQELKTARGELLRQAVESAVRAARELVEQRVQPADQARIADDYLAAVGAGLAGSDGGRS